MKILSGVQVYTLVFTAVLCQKDMDETGTYEFSFTIDGQQHRREKKDQAGIIQGEFGFITADGVYHVTVYATDENGDFKILSMRNIKISGPLDESSGRLTISPGEGILNNVNRNTQLKQTEKSLTQTEMTQTPKNYFMYALTTQPTIKPACGGCRYVTTEKPLQKMKSNFYNTGHFNEPPGLSNIHKINKIQSRTTGLPNVYNKNTPDSLSSHVSNMQQKGNLQMLSKQDITLPLSELQQVKNQNQGILFKQGENNLTQRLFQMGHHDNRIQSRVKSNLSKLHSSEKKGAIEGSLDYHSNIGNELILHNGSKDMLPIEMQATEPTRTGHNFPPSNSTVAELYPSTKVDEKISTSKEPLISRSGKTIHISGSKSIDIPIRDKFPGMVDGLPEGISIQDIKDVLYKFHYSLGFHGHYEKGLKSGAKIGGYFVNGRDGISRVVTYVADENGYKPKFTYINLGLNSPSTPKEGTEKQFGLKSVEFVWYPIE